MVRMFKDWWYGCLVGDCLDKQYCTHLKEEQLLEDQGGNGRISEAGTGWVPNPKMVDKEKMKHFK